MSLVRHQIVGPLATITVNNPTQNRIDHVMSTQLSLAISAIANSDARAVLLKADGPDFCLGGDIRPWPGMSLREMRQMLAEHLSVFNAFEQLGMPTIAAVQGRCFGGGLELAVRADIIFAGAGARFAHPEQSLGIVTLLGGIYRVAEKAGRARAMEWAMTSDEVPAEEMARIGVVNRVVADNLLQEAASAFALRIANGPTLAHAAHKALLAAWSAGGIPAADGVLLEIAVPLFASDDVRIAVPAAVSALEAGLPRPAADFAGR